MSSARYPGFNLAGLPSLPRGWSKGRLNLTAVKAQELKLESICVAGGKATVVLAP